MLARSARPTIAISDGADGRFRVGLPGIDPLDGVVPLQKVFTTMAVCVMPFGVSGTVPGTTLQVMVGVDGLVHVSVAFPVRPAELIADKPGAKPYSSGGRHCYAIKCLNVRLSDLSGVEHSAAGTIKDQFVF
jgi:hypothetical protein